MLRRQPLHPENNSHLNMIFTFFATVVPHIIAPMTCHVVCVEGSLSHSHVFFVLHRLPRLLAGTPTPLNITITAEEPRGETAAPPSCPLLIGSLF